jgi:hypothetical protein
MLTRIAAAIVATCALMASASAWAQDDAETKAEEQRINAAEQRMVDCLKRFPALEDGAWNAVEAQVRRRIAVCGKDYLTLLEQGGETAEASADLAFYGTIHKLGCRVANIDLDEFRHIPENLRMTTCSEERFVPSKAKWWAVIYNAGRVSSVAGPFDGIGECADSDEALAHVSTARCELSAFSPVVGQP